MRNTLGPSMLVLTGAAVLAVPGVSWAQSRSFGLVENSPHNLSVSGPGRHRATAEANVCVFCHTPHSSDTSVALWNREIPQGPYKIYESRSLRANVRQPTGVSKLCLSCHDGTVALGHVLSRKVPIGMAGGVLRMPPGPKTLGTDLSDDHPISFSYVSSLSGGEAKLLPPSAIASPVGLDENGEVQCTSCHFAHDNSYGDFLVTSNDFGELCLSCHNDRSWPSSIHATSTAIVPANVAAALGADRAAMAQNACNNCHRPHTAPGAVWLLHRDNISELCLKCHDGNLGQDVLGDIEKPSNHGLVIAGPPAVAQGPFVEGNRVSCADCHDSHATGMPTGTGVPSALADVPGVGIAGSPVSAVTGEHELCLRCHGDVPVQTRTSVDRIAFQPNKRLQFQPDNPSFHPIGSPGANGDVPSLIPPLVPTSQIGCADCHDSDTSRRLGGGGPAGPHGSLHEPLLAFEYEMVDFSPESSQAYALCYRCHSRDSILRDESFKGHEQHIVDARTPCSVCHDPHGISSAQGGATNHSHLMNFDRRVAFPSGSGRLEYEDLGRFRGRCYLTCHGKSHDPLEYSQ